MVGVTKAYRDKRRKMVLELNHAGKTKSAIANELSIDRQTVAKDLGFFLGQNEETVLQNTHRLRKEKWVKSIKEIIKALPYFTSRDIKPSLRTLFYRLASDGFISKTEVDYNQLIQHTVQARLKELDTNGELQYPELPIDCFADENRRVIDGYNASLPREPENEIDYIDDAIEELRNIPGGYDGRGRKGGYWYGQPEYVEVWIEKFALAPTFESFLKERYVNIAINKGYSSLTFLWENCKRLKDRIEEFGSDHVHVLYFGDFDPSGEDMVRSLKDYFKLFGLDPEILQKVALTQAQIAKYHIPTRPVKTKPKPGKKIGDTRAIGFKIKHGDNAAEIDAFFAVNPEAFEKMIQDSVDQYYDQSIYDEMEKKYRTSIPAVDLKQIHDKMFERITEAFRPGWEKDYAGDIEYAEEEEETDHD